MNENMTNDDVIATARGRIATDRAVGEIMLAVREAHGDGARRTFRRWDRVAAFALAASGVALLSGVLGREWLAARRAEPVSAPIRTAAQPPAVATLPSDVRVAMKDSSAVIDGPSAVHIDQPMRLSVVQGALRVESNGGITPPGR